MSLASWQIFALGSAFFAALTAIFGKLGVADISSNMATLIRTVVILGVIAALVLGRGEWVSLSTINIRTWVFLILSGLATGASWLCYYHALKIGPASRVAPVDKLSVVLAMIMAVVFLGERADAKLWIGGGLIAAGSFLLVL